MVTAMACSITPQRNLGAGLLSSLLKSLPRRVCLAGALPVMLIEEARCKYIGTTMDTSTSSVKRHLTATLHMKEPRVNRPFQTLACMNHSLGELLTEETEGKSAIEYRNSERKSRVPFRGILSRQFVTGGTNRWDGPVGYSGRLCVLLTISHVGDAMIRDVVPLYESEVLRFF